MEEAQAKTVNGGQLQAIDSRHLQDSRHIAAPAKSCINPAFDDPETFTCDCVEKAMWKCDGKNIDQCIRKLLCTMKDICEEWKYSDGGCSERSMSMSPFTWLPFGSLEMQFWRFLVVVLYISVSRSQLGLEYSYRFTCSRST